MLPTRSAQLTSRNLRVKIGSRHYRFKQWKGAIIQFHHHAIERAERIWYFDQMQRQWLIRPEHLSRGNAKKKRIADLSGCAGDSDFNGRLHDLISHR
jgi:hypothetical protein